MEKEKAVPRWWKDVVFIREHMAPNNKSKPTGSYYYIDMGVAEAIKLLTNALEAAITEAGEKAITSGVVSID